MTTNSAEAIAQEINEILNGILGHDSGETLDPNAALEDLGVDSLLAMDLHDALKAKYGVTLAQTAHVDYPSIRALATHVSTLRK